MGFSESPKFHTAMTDLPTTVPKPEALTSRLGRTGAVLAIVIALAWTPFPLGSAVTWGAPIFELLVGAAWAFWAVWASSNPSVISALLRPIWPTMLLCVAVLIWCAIQAVTFAPAVLKHPIWQMTSNALGHPVSGTISINPWKTKGEILKLIAEASVFLIVYSLSLRPKTAKTFLDAVIFTSLCYAVYGFALAIIGTTQASLIFGISTDEPMLSGPFMLHNSFATYCGLGAVASVVSLLNAANHALAGRSGRTFVLDFLQFVFGRSAIYLVSSLILFSALIASGSRAGFVSTLLAFAVLGAFALLRVLRTRSVNWAMIVVAIALMPLAFLLALNSDMLSDRLARLSDGSDLAGRATFWAAATRMIDVFPWTGLGLGTFEDSYPMFARNVLPFVIDKAHCDYLEFAAGVGLPAALGWWAALAWLAFLCFRGCFRRRRGALYCFAGFGAFILVAAHSAVDFSLQLPAVALSFTVLLAVGVGQFRPSEIQ
jgi:O-antigen ligase